MKEKEKVKGKERIGLFLYWVRELVWRRKYWKKTK